MREGCFHVNQIGQQAVNALNILRDQAGLREIPLDTYLQQIADAAGNGSAATPLTAREVELLLDELTTGPTLPVLPSGFSRTDIYAEHD